ncbi:MAG: dinitrogenase iron-molybdenum cofactor biosynthesis protein [Lachnospiraceae bacterium]|nr:dinitrogenase iron-molybdenum cofactor biosynthesis protein [Lachnospiraceae bacterium]
MVRIAVASTDGKLVNQHFGRADRFYILETEEDTAEFKLAEERNTVPVCVNGDHEENQMEQAASNLSDCQYVLVSRIGMRARNELEARGLKVYEMPGIIEESVDKLIRYIKVQKLLDGI